MPPTLSTINIFETITKIQRIASLITQTKNKQNKQQYMETCIEIKKIGMCVMGQVNVFFFFIEMGYEIEVYALMNGSMFWKKK